MCAHTSPEIPAPMIAILMLDLFAAPHAPDHRRALPRTLRSWLRRLDERAAEALAILRRGRSERDARTLLGTWRLFLLSTAEMWGWRGGDEWMLSRYLLERERRGGSGKKPLVRAT